LDGLVISAQGQFCFPYDIAISEKSGNIAVADYYNNRVQLLNADGIYLREDGQKGLDARKLSLPRSVAFKSGDVIICDSSGILCLTESGQFIKNISNKHLNQPVPYLAIACDGRMLVCNRGDKTVKVLSPDGTQLLQSFRALDCDELPYSAVSHRDSFYVCYVLAKCVKVFTNEGQFLYDIGTEGPGKLHRPSGLAVDKFNNLLVCDGVAENVKVFTLEGKFINSIEGQATEFWKPWAVAVSKVGQVFITDVGKHCVHVFE